MVTIADDQESMSRNLRSGAKQSAAMLATLNRLCDSSRQFIRP